MPDLSDYEFILCFVSKGLGCPSTFCLHFSHPRQRLLRHPQRLTKSPLPAKPNLAILSYQADRLNLFGVLPASEGNTVILGLGPACQHHCD